MYTLRSSKNKKKDIESKSDNEAPIFSNIHKKRTESEREIEPEPKPGKKVKLEIIPEIPQFVHFYQILKESTQMMFKYNEFQAENLEFSQKSKIEIVTLLGELPLPKTINNGNFMQSLDNMLNALQTYHETLKPKKKRKNKLFQQFPIGKTCITKSR
jgi:hypothetical protein